ncbi:FKBP-type peptidyl-prolyl cis-trans isomerase [Agromyces sp. SYSU T0242]|uniref:FKBP-type peptidyl-prolyl cis-trans isomerase n=1 Tax=Agromyces litoreus TaxID=3158561 RepID=UPI00339536D6
MNRALRRGAPLALATVTALLLVGCAGGGDEPEATPSEEAAGSCFDVESGEQSDAIEVSGDFGGTPTATFDTPVEADGLQRTVVDEGDGDLTAPGDSVSAQVTAFSGSTGEQIFSQPATLELVDGTLYDGFRAGADCVPIGSRVVTVAPAESIYGEQGNESIGVAPGETLVIVTDVQELVELPVPGQWSQDVPTVDYDDDGTPVLTIPDAEPSDELLVKVLEQGDGEVVGEDDVVTVDYQGVNWETGEVFDQSFGRAPAPFSINGVIPGFGAALVGQTVGTKLLVTIPPALGYGEGETSNGLGGQTLVFYVDITETRTDG